MCELVGHGTYRRLIKSYEDERHIELDSCLLLLEHISSSKEIQTTDIETSIYKTNIVFCIYTCLHLFLTHLPRFLCRSNDILYIYMFTRYMYLVIQIIGELFVQNNPLLRLCV